MKIHSDHHEDCIRFSEIPHLINQYILAQGKIIQQSNEIYIQIKNQIESNIKKMNDNIYILKDLSNYYQLKNNQNSNHQLI
ncbi:unnamed protein product [Paramecium pentaurelia]|uniref:Uncharacterized protein n=1 Tax=Paramecium pentaurelia TaxID=43138 RepID=A0A8S1TWE8_9CILI|nr:unnamed protein product [Paramecium pentaurelia]